MAVSLKNLNSKMFGTKNWRRISLIQKLIVLIELIKINFIVLFKNFKFLNFLVDFIKKNALQNFLKIAKMQSFGKF